MQTENKKKILYVITKSNWGGAQRYVFDLAINMKNIGLDAVVALGGDGVLKQKLDKAGIRTISISKLGRNVSLSKDTGSFKEIYSIIKKERPDILHLNSPKAAGLGALAGKVLGIKKIIYTVHGWAFNENRPLWQKTVIAFFSWLTVLFCHKVILLSEKELGQTKRFPFVKRKLVLIPLGIRPPEFMEAVEAKKEIGERILFDISNKIAIGTIAELHPNKGLPYLIGAMTEVAKKHPNAICVIIGDGQEKNSLQSLIKEKRLEKNVFLAGYIDEASRYLKAFDIFVLPSLKEGLPYVILEAGLASVPVVATNVGGISEVIENEKTGFLIEPQKTTMLNRTLETLIGHPEKRSNFSKTLHAHMETKFSLKDMLSHTDKLYR